MNNSLKELANEQISAVMQAGYQLIVSANYNTIGAEDDDSIDIIYRYLGFEDSTMSRNIGTLIWNEAINMSPYSSFEIIKKFNNRQKLEFRRMILEIVHQDRNKEVARNNCAKQLFQLCDAQINIPFFRAEQKAILTLVAAVAIHNGERTQNEKDLLDTISYHYSLSPEEKAEALKGNRDLACTLVYTMDYDKKWLISCILQAAAMADGDMGLFKPQWNTFHDIAKRSDLPENIHFYDTVETTRQYLGC